MKIPDVIKYFFLRYENEAWPYCVPEDRILVGPKSESEFADFPWETKEMGEKYVDSDEDNPRFITYVSPQEVVEGFVTQLKYYSRNMSSDHVEAVLEYAKSLGIDIKRVKMGKPAQDSKTNAPKKPKKVKKGCKLEPKLYKSLISKVQDKSPALPVSDAILFEEYTGEIQCEREIVLTQATVLTSPSGKKQITLEPGHYVLVQIRSPFSYDSETREWEAVKCRLDQDEETQEWRESIKYLPAVYGKSAISWAIVLGDSPQ